MEDINVMFNNDVPKYPMGIWEVLPFSLVRTNFSCNIKAGEL